MKVTTANFAFFSRVFNIFKILIGIRILKRATALLLMAALFTPFVFIGEAQTAFAATPMAEMTQVQWAPPEPFILPASEVSSSDSLSVSLLSLMNVWSNFASLFGSAGEKDAGNAKESSVPEPKSSSEENADPQTATSMWEGGSAYNHGGFQILANDDVVNPNGQNWFFIKSRVALTQDGDWAEYDFQPGYSPSLRSNDGLVFHCLGGSFYTQNGSEGSGIPLVAGDKVKFELANGNQVKVYKNGGYVYTFQQQRGTAQPLYISWAQWYELPGGNLFKRPQFGGSGILLDGGNPVINPNPTPTPTATPTPAQTRINYALASNGGVASASSADPSYLPSNVINGNRPGTNMSVWISGIGLPQWLEVDFGQLRTIDEINAFIPQDNYQNPVEPTLGMTCTSNFCNTGFEVQYWNGSAWANVASVTGNNKVWRQFTFSPVTTNKIRVVVTATGDNYAYLTEVEAWGGSGNVAPTPTPTPNATPTPNPTPSPTPSGPSSTAADVSRARLSPKNAIGGTNLYSRNFGWSSGLVGLPGRGLNAGFGVSYNSLIWLKSGNDIVFDPDKSNITPGFRFGYPVVEPAYIDGMTGKNTFLMVTPSGARAEFRQVDGTSDTFETVDSSYAQIKVTGAGTLTVLGTDGTQTFYESKGGAFRVSQIKDSNGNFVTVNHDSNGVLQSVTDTLGRSILVTYDGNGRPATVIQTRQDGTHTYARFAYADLTVSTNFAGLNLVGVQNGATVKVLKKITFADDSFAEFDYNAYGQVWRVNNHAPDGNKLNHVSVNLENPGQQTDAPRFSETRSLAQNFNMVNGQPQEVLITNDYQENQTFALPGGSQATGTMIQVTAPDNTISKTFVGSSGWMEGLPVMSEDWADENGNLSRKRWSYTAYTQDDPNLSYMLNPRAVETKVGDAANVRRTTVTYHQQFGLPNEVKVYDADQQTVLKRSVTGYNLDNAYVSRRIIGLPAENLLFDANNNVVSKITYNYDESDFSGAGQTITPVQHDAANYGAGFVAGRGNPTSTVRWDAEAPTDGGRAVTSRVRYNTAGLPVAQIDPLNRTVSISYTDSFVGDTQNYNTFAYPTTLTDPAGNSSTVKYRYDIGANVYATSPAPAGNTQGKITSRIYDAFGRLERETVNNTGAYTRYVYEPNGIQSKVFSTVTDFNNNNQADAGDEIESESLFDGAGRVRKSRSQHPGSSGGWSATQTEYDLMGRVKRQSVPTEVDPNWNPAGDDAARGWLWTQQEYDWKGRVTKSINTDGTFKTMSYEGCGCAGGQVVTIQGEQLAEGRRTQKIYEDILGRQYKSETLNWNGTVYSTVKTTFNGRDQAVLVRQYSGDENSSVYQDTTMSYDGHGRLKTQHRPEQAANAATVMAYNADDSLSVRTDARGATAAYTYDNRALVTRIDYVLPGAANPTPTPTPSSTNSPIGNFDGIDGMNRTAWGWTLDPDNAAASNVVQFYVDGPMGQGTFAGTAAASNPRADVNQSAGQPGNHGFVFNIPDQYADGNQHTIYAYGIDTGSNTPTLLTNSPRSFAFAPLSPPDPTPTPTPKGCVGEPAQICPIDTYWSSQTCSCEGGVMQLNAMSGGAEANLLEANPPAPPPVNPSVIFTYDAIGNRTSMTDSQGVQTYEYNQLSQLTAETRQFNDTLQNAPMTNNGFKLQYAYSLSGQLKSLTDPYGQQINYGHDRAGRLQSVTGSAFGGVTTYANNPQYRAWGALKGLSYGNGAQMSMSYNNRLQTSSLQLTGGGQQPQQVMQKNYDYYADGNLRYLQDVIDNRFDRLNKYDHMGRVVEGKSGAEARGQSVTPQQQSLLLPYRQSYQYDAFGHLTERNNLHWGVDTWYGQSNNLNYTYQNNRVNGSGWQYDADGRVIQTGAPDENNYSTYDAAGRLIMLSDGATDIYRHYDGNGREVKRIRSVFQHNPNATSPPYWSYNNETTYYIRSSVMSNETISEVDYQGKKVKTFIKAAGATIATQNVYSPTNQQVKFEHWDASGMSRRTTDQTGNAQLYSDTDFSPGELDPMGGNTGTETPYVEPIEPEPQPDPFMPEKFRLFDESPLKVAGQSVSCSSDGIDIPCSMAIQSLQSGAALVSGGDPFVLSQLGLVAHYSTRPTERSHAPDDPNRVNEDGEQIVSVYTDEERYITHYTLHGAMWDARAQVQQVGFRGDETNKIAQLADCLELFVPDFDKLDKENPAALTLLNNTYGADAKEKYGRMTTYEKAVLLNTAAAAHSVGVNLSKAELTGDGFYRGNKPATYTPYGITVKGISGVTSGRHENYGSVEVNAKKGFIDVDLFAGGIFSPVLGEHLEERNFNIDNKRGTHPGDVILQLEHEKRKVKVKTGVSCRRK